MNSVRRMNKFVWMIIHVPIKVLTCFCVPSAVVTILLKDPKTGASFVKTATVMKRGMSFGVRDEVIIKYG